MRVNDTRQAAGHGLLVVGLKCSCCNLNLNRPLHSPNWMDLGTSEAN